MPKNEGALHPPFSAIIFDCDGTLCTIEGIDELAKQNGVAEEVGKMTADAMGRTGLSLALYQDRLHLVKPTKTQVNTLGDAYIKNLTPHAHEVIQLLHQLDKTVYLVSAGLYPAIVQLGEYLHIPKSCIYAVNIQFDAQGHYADFDRQSPLVTGDGKRQVVTDIKKAHSRLAYVGDGLNDLATKDLVSRFIGYGGIFYRKIIEDACDFYVRSSSMKAVIPLLLTDSEQNQLR